MSAKGVIEGRVDTGTRLLGHNLFVNVPNFNYSGARAGVETAESVKVIAAEGREVQDHDGDSVGLASANYRTRVVLDSRYKMRLSPRRL